jgi:peptide/nickel transport system substrate-binding protein
VRAISENIEFTYIQNTQNRVQISYTQWYPDYPEASDFLNVLFSCASFREGSDASVNIAGLCDHALDAEFVTALSLAGSDPVAANRLWSELDRKVTDLAPVAVMFNPKRANFMSQRVKNIVISNQFQWLFAQSWVQ